MPFDRTSLLPVALLLILLAACQATPTPTLVPIPTATYIPTETPITPAPTPTPIILRAVVTETLRVREQPATSARILARLKKDTRVLLRARTDDSQWYALEFPPDSGEPGWIAAGYVIADAPTDMLPVGFTSPPPPPGAIYARVTHNVNVRAGPSKEYDVVTTLPGGVRVTLLARTQDGQWFQIRDPRDPNKRAWLTGELLELLGAPAPMPIAAPPPTPTPGPTPIPRPTLGPAATGRILMTSNRGGAYDIYTVADNGVVRARLTRFGESFGARFSPDGSHIVFYHIVATTPVLTAHIYTLNADGTNLVELSKTPNVSDTDPDWSPDGKSIAFVRTPRAGAPEIWVMNADGANARRVIALSTATTPDEFSPKPRWSPDGGRLAYAAVPRVKNPGAPLYPNIFVIGSDGANETQLTDNDLINSTPVWSPNGRQLAWSAKDFINRQNWRVWVMSASGGNQRPLLDSFLGDANNGAQAVEWLGNRLLLAGWTGNWNIYIANADGSGVTPITRERADDKATDWLP